jgi:uncharacterized membrane protein (DUF106 family)
MQAAQLRAAIPSAEHFEALQEAMVARNRAQRDSALKRLAMIEEQIAKQQAAIGG